MNYLSRFVINMLCVLVLALFISVMSEKNYACTSVCLVKNRNVVFGDNLDWLVVEGMVVINKRNVQKRGIWFNNPPVWRSKYASVTVNQDGREFPSRGMNEAGLVIGEMTFSETEYPDRDSRYSINNLQWTQYQLDNCATVDEVIATDKVIRIEKTEYPSHFFICDSSGNCATIEWINGKLHSHSKKQLPVNVLANHSYDYCLEHGDDPTGRFRTAAEMLKNYKSGNPVEYVFSILKAVSREHTKWSLVFDSKKRIMYYKTALNREMKYVSLNDFDLSCDAKVLVLDINSAGSGNMRSLFIPYSEEFNSKMLRGISKQLEAQFGVMPEERLQTIIKYPGTTTCGDSALPIKLNQNYPNPFNPSTNIQYSLNKPSQVKLSIYNLLGQEIKSLTNSFQSAGEYSLVWDATDEGNNPVSSGMYCYKLETNGMTLCRKMMLLQ